jgi:hypothetical protein
MTCLVRVLELCRTSLPPQRAFQPPPPCPADPQTPHQHQNKYFINPKYTAHISPVPICYPESQGQPISPQLHNVRRGQFPKVSHTLHIDDFSLFVLSIVIAPTRGAQSVLHNTDAMSLDPNLPEVTLEGKRKQVFEDVSEVCCCFLCSCRH